MKKRQRKKSKENFLKRINFKVLLTCFAIVFLIEILGGLFTAANVSTIWYLKIRPFITPPNWVFLVVWNILFFLIALSLYCVWTKSDDNKKQRDQIALSFGVNLFLNLLWSFLFFVIKNPIASLVEIFFLWASILFMIFVTYKIDVKCAYFLVPYSLWVAYAGILNAITVLFP